MLTRREVLMGTAGLGVARPSWMRGSNRAAAEDLLFLGHHQSALLVAPLGWDKVDPVGALQMATNLEPVIRFRRPTTPLVGRSAWLSFVLCGTEPTRVELEGVLRELASHVEEPAFVVLRAPDERPKRLVALAQQLQTPIIVASDPSFEALAAVVTALGVPLVVHGYVGLDFVDFRAVCCGPQVGRVFDWVAKVGSSGCVAALPRAVTSFLDSTVVNGAFLTVVGHDATLQDLHEVTTDIADHLDVEANFLFAAVVDLDPTPMRCWLTLFHS